MIPPVTEPELNAIKEDIRKHGQLMPIVLHEGKILDGCSRYRACRELGIEGRFVERDGKGDPVEYVLSTNLRRRHLTETGRAMVGARMLAHFEKAAKERQGSRTDISANLRESHKWKSSEDAAQVVKVSSRSVESAKRVLTKGIPKLIKRVESGTLRLGQASKVAALTEDEQERLLSMPKAERSQALSQQTGGRASRPAAKHNGEGNHKSLAERWSAAVAVMLELIEQAQASGFSEFPLEVVTEGLERLQAAVSHSGAVSHGVSTSADDYADADQGNEESPTLEIQAATSLNDLVPSAVGLSETLAMDETAAPESEAESVANPDVEVGGSQDQRPECLGKSFGDKARCTGRKPCNHGEECKAGMVEARAKRLPWLQDQIKSSAEPKDSAG